MHVEPTTWSCYPVCQVIMPADDLLAPQTTEHKGFCHVIFTMWSQWISQDSSREQDFWRKRQVQKHVRITVDWPEQQWRAGCLEEQHVKVTVDQPGQQWIAGCLEEETSSAKCQDHSGLARTVAEAGFLQEEISPPTHHDIKDTLSMKMHQQRNYFWQATFRVAFFQRACIMSIISCIKLKNSSKCIWRTRLTMQLTKAALVRRTQSPVQFSEGDMVQLQAGEHNSCDWDLQLTSLNKPKSTQSLIADAEECGY